MFGADTHGGRDRAISVKKFEGPSVFGESCAREPQDSPRRSTALVIARAVTSSYHEGEAGHAVHPGRVAVRGGTGRRGRPSPVAEAAPIAGGKMIAGHFGFAAAVKSRETAAPLWALMLATVWLDVVFVPLFLTYVETIKAVSGPPGAYGGGEIFADNTHSLVGAVALSVLLGLGALGLGLWRWPSAFGRARTPACTDRCSALLAGCGEGNARSRAWAAPADRGRQPHAGLRCAGAGAGYIFRP